MEEIKSRLEEISNFGYLQRILSLREEGVLLEEFDRIGEDFDLLSDVPRMILRREQLVIGKVFAEIRKSLIDRKKII